VYVIISFLGVVGKDVRIIGGENTSTSTYSYVAMFKYLVNNHVLCCGSIISYKHILTTANCLYYEASHFNHIRIYTGINEVVNNQGQENKIAHVYYHPRFTGEVKETGIRQHDVAVVLV
jgi:secreted trypsin-like serine protease